MSASNLTAFRAECRSDADFIAKSMLGVFGPAAKDAAAAVMTWVENAPVDDSAAAVADQLVGIAAASDLEYVLVREVREGDVLVWDDGEEQRVVDQGVNGDGDVLLWFAADEDAAVFDQSALVQVRAISDLHD